MAKGIHRHRRDASGSNRPQHDIIKITPRNTYHPHLI